MNRIFLLLIVMLTSHMSFCKNVILSDTGMYNKTLFILQFQDKPTVTSRFAIIDLNSVDSSDVINKFTEKHFCKFLGVEQVIVYDIHPGTRIYTLNELLTMFKVNKRSNTKRVKFDGDFVLHPENFLFTPINWIATIKVEKDKNGYFIHIILK